MKATPEQRGMRESLYHERREIENEIKNLDPVIGDMPSTSLQRRLRNIDQQLDELDKEIRNGL